MDQYGEWQDRAVEALAAAWYRAHGFSKGQLNPRWEMVDEEIKAAWRRAANRYVATGELREPVLVMEPFYIDGKRASYDVWREK